MNAQRSPRRSRHGTGFAPAILALGFNRPRALQANLLAQVFVPTAAAVSCPKVPGTRGAFGKPHRNDLPLV